MLPSLSAPFYVSVTISVWWTIGCQAKPLLLLCRTPKSCWNHLKVAATSLSRLTHTVYTTQLMSCSVVVSDGVSVGVSTGASVGVSGVCVVVHVRYISLPQDLHLSPISSCTVLHPAEAKCLIHRFVPDQCSMHSMQSTPALTLPFTRHNALAYRSRLSS